MSHSAFHSQLLQDFEALPRQLRIAAQWVLDNPRDVALLSMRVQAERAGVSPACMTRLAQRMGLGGYEELRVLYAESLRRGETGHSGKDGEVADLRKNNGAAAVAFDLAETLERHMAALRDPATLKAVTEATAILKDARRIYVLGYRLSYPVAFHFAYVYGCVRGEVRLLDGAGGLGPVPLREAGEDDVLVAVDVKPYASVVLEPVDYALRRGLSVVAITDSVVSPLLERARTAIVVPTKSQSFFHTMTPAFAIAEMLAASLAAAAGESALAAARGIEHNGRQS